MNIEGVDDWLVDAIIQFLQSPLWKNPLQAYIDEYCMIFTGGENKFGHNETHKEYKKLIENLLEEHLVSMGITTEQFMKCCHEGQKKDAFLKAVFNYILAMDDFLTFGKMMEARNKELELESLQQMKIEYEEKKTKDAVDVKKTKTESTDDDLLEMALKESIKEQAFLKIQQEKEEADLRHAIALSLASQEEMFLKAKNEAMNKKSNEPVEEKPKFFPTLTEKQEETIKKMEEMSGEDAKKQLVDEMMKEKIEAEKDTQEIQHKNEEWKDLERKKFEELKKYMNSPKPQKKKGPKEKQRTTQENMIRLRNKLIETKRKQIIEMKKRQRKEQMKTYLEDQKKEAEKVEVKIEERELTEEEIERINKANAFKNMLMSKIQADLKGGKIKRKKKKKSGKKKKKKKKANPSRKKKMSALFSGITVDEVTID